MHFYTFFACVVESLSMVDGHYRRVYVSLLLCVILTLEAPSLRDLARMIMNVMCHGNLP